MTVTVRTEDDGKCRATVPADGLRCCEHGHASEDAAAQHAWRLATALARTRAERDRR